MGDEKPSPSPARPLLVSHSGDPGGSNQVLLSLLRHAPSGLEPACVFLADGPAVAAAERLGAAVELLEAGPARKVWRAPGIVRRLVQSIRRHRADVVFAHVAKAHGYSSPAARRLGVPYLWWQHDLPAATPLNRLAARLPAAAVICSSRFTAERQRALGSSHVVAVHPGIELGDEPAGPTRPEGRGPLVGAVGRLRRYKRYELLLAAAPYVLEAEPETRFVVAGGPTADADYPGQLAAQADALGISGAVELAGHVEPATGLIADFDVLVHTAHLEPFGLVVAEALLRGVPVVCPQEGGPAEIVEHGVHGLHAAVEDPRALSSAILTLLRDGPLRARMGVAGARHVRAAFSAERMAADAWRLAGRTAGAQPSRP